MEYHPGPGNNKLHHIMIASCTGDILSSIIELQFGPPVLFLGDSPSGIVALCPAAMHLHNVPDDYTYTLVQRVRGNVDRSANAGWGEHGRFLWYFESPSQVVNIRRELTRVPIRPLPSAHLYRRLRSRPRPR